MTSTHGLSNTRLDRLTSLRFFAALAVVVHHTSRDLAEIPLLTNFASMGTAGVGFFFILSGFVLTWSSRESDTPGAFYRRRFARVYPLHLFGFLVGIPLLLGMGQGIRTSEWLPNLFLVQAWIPDSRVYFGVNSPSWSLSAELFFYLMFPLTVIPLKRLIRQQVQMVLVSLLVVGVVLALVVTVLVGVGEESRFLLYVSPAYRFIGFLSGCVAARLVALGFRTGVTVRIAVAMLSVAYIALYAGQRELGGVGHGIEDAFLAPFIVILFLSAASADLDQRSSFLTKKPLIRLGEWSFALYLTHWLLLQGAAYIDPGANDRPVLARIAEDGLFIAIAIALSGIAYKFVEKPLERRLRGPRVRSDMNNTVRESDTPASTTGLKKH